MIITDAGSSLLLYKDAGRLHCFWKKTIIYFAIIADTGHYWQQAGDGSADNLNGSHERSAAFDDESASLTSKLVCCTRQPVIELITPTVIHSYLDIIIFEIHFIWSTTTT